MKMTWRRLALVFSVAGGVAALTTPALVGPESRAPVDPARGVPTPPLVAAPASASLAYLQSPLFFERNDGQADASVAFLARTAGFDLLLTSPDAVMVFQPGRRTSDRTAAPQADVLRMRVVGAHPAPRIRGAEPLPGRSHYYRGRDPAKWQTNVPHFGRVEYENVRPGVDVSYYGRQQQLEYDIVVHEGADPSQVRLEFEGAETLARDGDGNLVIALEGGTLLQRAPVAYQEIDGRRRPVESRYVLAGPAQVGFEVGAYDRRHALVIDPVLSFSTYWGGNGQDWPLGIDIDGLGNVYITGQVRSTNLPLANAIQGFQGLSDAFVAKFVPGTGAVVYSTYLGGSATDYATDIAVTAAGQAHIVGSTGSLNFPLAGSPAQPFLAGGFGDGFYTKLSATGALLYSTYWGSSNMFGDYASAVAVDGGGNAYVTGIAQVGFPVTAGAFQTFHLPPIPPNTGQIDAFITKFNAAGGVVYSTLLGGSGQELAEQITVDAAGNAYVAGSTMSADFDVTPGALQTTLPGSFAGFLTKLNAAGSGLVYSTFFGTMGAPTGIALAPGNEVVLTGRAFGGFPPVTAGAYQPSTPPATPGYITRLNATGSAIVRSAWFDEYVQSTDTDSTGNVYFAGVTNSPAFPAKNSLPFGGGSCVDFRGNPVVCTDVFVAKLSADLSTLRYATFLGGAHNDSSPVIAADNDGQAYVAGLTASTNFPLVNHSQGVYAGGFDGFIARLSPATNLQVTKTASVDRADEGSALTYTITVTNSGELAASNVVLSDTLPAGASFVSATPPCVYAVPTVTCALGTLDSDASVTVTIDVIGAVPGALLNEASATSDGPEFSPADNSSQAEVAVENVPPTAHDDSADTNEDEPVVIDVLANDDDPGEGPLSVQSATSGAHGHVDISGDELIYTPDEHFHGVDTFQYTVSDGYGGMGTAFVTVTVASVNDAPVLSGLADRVVDEGDALVFTATAGDADGDGLAFSLLAAPDGAAIDPVTGAFVWTPTEAQGPGTFTFTIHVVDNGSPPLADDHAMTVTVEEVNVAPVLGALPDFAIDEETPLAFAASATDADLPATGLTFSLIGAPAGAAIDPATGAFSWTPGETEGPGVFAFTVRVTDGGAPVLSDETLLTVTVNETNAAPVLSAIGNRTVDEGSPLVFAAGATDHDLPVNGLSFAMIGGPPGATIDAATGAFAWTPAEAQGPGSYTFTIRVTDDGVPALADEETVTVAVREVNTAPVLDPVGNQVVDEGVLLTFGAHASDADEPATPLSFMLIGAPPGVTVDAAGTCSWTPTEAQGPGTFAFTLRVTDGELFDEEAIAIEVREVNTAPVLAPIGDRVVDEETVLTFVAAAGDTDVPANTLTFELLGAPDGASIDPVTGTFSWTPTEAQGPGSFSATIRVSDGVPAAPADEEHITITVREVNKPPAAADDSYGTPEDVALHVTAPGVLANDLDPDGQSPSAVLVSGPASGTLAFHTDGSFEYVPAPDTFGVVSFVYRATDGALDSADATVTIAVESMNDAPTAHPQTLTTLAATPLAITLSASDVDGDSLTFTVASLPLHGTLSGAPPALIYTPDLTFVGEDSFTFTARDGTVTSAAALVTIDVNGGVGGRMTGGGFVARDVDRHHFTVSLEERDRVVNGSFTYLGQQAEDRHDRFDSLAITAVTFTNASTAVFRGIGVWNGTPGYAIEGVVIDAGEPGRNDTLAIVIRAPGGAVAADVRGQLAGGNVRARR